MQDLRTRRMHAHSYVSQDDIYKWFYSIFDHYLKWNKIKEYTLSIINSIWVNEMKAGEDYNPVHIHQGKLCIRGYPR